MHTLMSSFSNTHIAYQVHTCSYIQKIIPIPKAKGLPIEMWYKPTFPQMFSLTLPSFILSHFQSSSPPVLGIWQLTYKYISMIMSPPRAQTWVETTLVMDPLAEFTNTPSTQLCLFLTLFRELMTSSSRSEINLKP